MCQEHWRVYTRGLRKDALARKAGEASSDDSAPAEPKTRGRKTRKTTNSAAVAAEVERAEVLIAEVDALAGPEHVKRVGDKDVQAALETVAAANGSARETPLGGTGEGGTGEADAA